MHRGTICGIGAADTRLVRLRRISLGRSVNRLHRALWSLSLLLICRDNGRNLSVGSGGSRRLNLHLLGRQLLAIRRWHRCMLPGLLRLLPVLRHPNRCRRSLGLRRLRLLTIRSWWLRSLKGWLPVG